MMHESDLNLLFPEGEREFPAAFFEKGSRHPRILAEEYWLFEKKAKAVISRESFLYLRPAAGENGIRAVEYFDGNRSKGRRGICGSHKSASLCSKAEWQNFGRNSGNQSAQRRQGRPGAHMCAGGFTYIAGGKKMDQLTMLQLQCLKDLRRQTAENGKYNEAETARRVGVNRSTVSRWMKKSREQGLLLEAGTDFTKKGQAFTLWILRFISREKIIRVCPWQIWDFINRDVLYMRKNGSIWN